MKNHRAGIALRPRAATLAVAAAAILTSVLAVTVPAGAQSTNLTISTSPDHNISLTPVIHPTGPGANLNVTTLVTAVQTGPGGQTAILTYGGFEGTPDSGEPGNIVFNAPLVFTLPGGRELFIGSLGTTTVNNLMIASGQGFVTFAPLGSVDVEASLTGSGAGADIGFKFAARAQVLINGPITTVGIRGIDIRAQSDDGTMGTAVINQPLTVTSGLGQVSVFAEQGITIASALTVDQGYISIFSDHAAIQVDNAASFTGTGSNTRPAPDGGQIFLGAGTDITLGTTAGAGGPIPITTTDGLLTFRAGGNLDIAKATIAAGASLTATAGGNVTVKSAVTAGGSGTDQLLVKAGKSFTLAATGSLQAANGASGIVVVDDANPTRPALSLTALFTNQGTLALGPAGMIFAVGPAQTALGGYVPPGTLFGIWFGDPGAVVGINYKVSDPLTTPTIPTLSSLGLAALGALLAFASLGMLRRKRA